MLRYVLLAGLVVSARGLGQENATANAAEEAATVLDRVVVVGARLPRPVADVAGSVTVLTTDDIERELVTDLTTLVRYEPGIAIESAGTRFAPRGFNIRGVGGNRVKVEYDGVPIADHFAIGNFSHSGRDGVDPEFLSRMEVLRGPASSLYGSDAIGGVAALFSMGPADYLNRTDGNRYFGLKSNYDSINQGWLLHGALAGQSETAGFSIAASHRRFDEWANQSSLPAARDDLLDGRSSSLLGRGEFSTAGGGGVGVTVDATRRQRDSDIRSILGQGRFRSTTLLIGDDEYRRDRVSLNVDPVWSGLDAVQGHLYYQQTDVEQFTVDERAASAAPVRRERLFEYAQDLFGATLFAERSIRGESVEQRLVFGIDLKSREIEERRDAVQIDLTTGAATNVVIGETFPLRDFPKTRVNEFGAFVQDEMLLDEHWTLIPALRFDHYDLDPQPDPLWETAHPDLAAVDIRESSLSPKLGVIREIGDSMQWFAQYAHGFRAPPFNDANLSLNIPLFNIRSIPNPDLESETSDSIEWGLRQASATNSLEIALFYSRYRDFIESNTPIGVDPATGVLLFQSINLDRARIYGAELRWGQELRAWNEQLDGLYVDVGAFIADGEDRTTGNPIDSLDPAHVIAGIGWRAARWPLDIRLVGTAYAAKDDVASPVDQFVPPGYAVFDLLASWQPADNLQVDVGIFNLGDRKYWTWQSVRGLEPGDPLLEVLSAAGTSISIGARLDF